MTIAFLFPGQGSQYVSMGKDLYETFIEAKEVFDEVDDTLSRKLSTIIFSGEQSDLNSTINTQPALMAVSTAVIKVLERQSGKTIDQLATVAAGHSLGEYPALCAAKSLTLCDTTLLLDKRAKFMSAAKNGAMLALLGTNIKIAEEIIRQMAQLGICDIANDNGVGQVIISGESHVIDYIVENIKQYDVKRAIKLPVSAAFHSRLMNDAQKEMALELDKIDFKPPLIDIYSNVTLNRYINDNQIKDGLTKQISGRVKWRETMEKFVTQLNVDLFIEIGAGKVLSNIASKMFPSCVVQSISTPLDIENYLKKL